MKARKLVAVVGVMICVGLMGCGKDTSRITEETTVNDTEAQEEKTDTKIEVVSAEPEITESVSEDTVEEPQGSEVGTYTKEDLITSLRSLEGEKNTEIDCQMNMTVTQGDNELRDVFEFHFASDGTNEHLTAKTVVWFSATECGVGYSEAYVDLSTLTQYTSVADREEDLGKTWIKHDAEDTTNKYLFSVDSFPSIELGEEDKYGNPTLVCTGTLADSGNTDYFSDAGVVISDLSDIKTTVVFIFDKDTLELTDAYMLCDDITVDDVVISDYSLHVIYESLGDTPTVKIPSEVVDNAIIYQ